MLLPFSLTFPSARALLKIPAIQSFQFIQPPKVGEEVQNCLIFIVLANLGAV